MNLLARAKSSTNLFSSFASSGKHLFYRRHISALQHCNFYATRTSHTLPVPATYEVGNVGFSPEKRGNEFGESVAKKKDAYQIGNLWMRLLNDPLQWYDYRQHKTNGLVKETFPDFKQKGTGEALWISAAPKSLLPELGKLECDVKDLKPKQVQGGENRDGGLQESWTDLVENPGKWWDNRANKRNPKSPDFKHKETGKGLWITDAPESVLPRLGKSQGGENENSSEKNQNGKIGDSWTNLVENPSEWSDNRANKINQKWPGFKHKETGKGLWITDAPESVLPQLGKSQGGENENSSAQNQNGKIGDYWTNLVENPSECWDNRADKRNPKSPDFKHKETGKGLWITNAPESVLPRLGESQGGENENSSAKNQNGKIGDSWTNLVENPSEWWDNRANKINQKWPDFKHKETGKGLWITDAPESVLPQLGKSQGGENENSSAQNQNGKIGDYWTNLVENPSEWWDNRADKRNPKSPDFKHKETGKGLWITNAPESVLPRLGESQGGENENSSEKNQNGKIGDCWTNLVENPSEWWDNRANKINQKWPDFKHKETGKGLWITDAPESVLPRLGKLGYDVNDLKPEQSQGGVNCSAKNQNGKLEGSWKNLVENPKSGFDVEDLKPEQSQGGVNCSAKNQHGKLEDSWKNLVENPKSGFDVEDLKLEQSQGGVNCSAKNQHGKLEDSWKNLVENPKSGFDVKDLKPEQSQGGVNCNAKNQNGKLEGSWKNLVENPKSVFDVKDLKPEQLQGGVNYSAKNQNGKLEDSWKNLVENPNKWWDNRRDKRNPKAPDFKHKETGEGLWLNRSPDWALSKLPPVKADQNTTIGRCMVRDW